MSNTESINALYDTTKHKTLKGHFYPKTQKARNDRDIFSVNKDGVYCGDSLHISHRIVGKIIAVDMYENMLFVFSGSRKNPKSKVYYTFDVEKAELLWENGFESYANLDTDTADICYIPSIDKVCTVSMNARVIVGKNFWNVDMHALNQKGTDGNITIHRYEGKAIGIYYYYSRPRYCFFSISFSDEGSKISHILTSQDHGKVPKPRQGTTTFIDGENIYLYGGVIKCNEHGQHKYNDIWRFNFDDWHWTRLIVEQKPLTVKNKPVVFLNNFVRILGANLLIPTKRKGDSLVDFMADLLLNKGNIKTAIMYKKFLEKKPYHGTFI